MSQAASKVGKRGVITLPARMRRRFGLDEGSFVVAEERAEGILIRPAEVIPVEIYTREREAEFILNNAVDAADYKRACAAVKRMGLNPATIDHFRPPYKLRRR